MKAEVLSYRFFDDYYLRPEEDEDGNQIWDSGFYEDGGWCEPPEFHDMFVAQAGVNRLLVLAAPRGGAKSSACRKRIIRNLISHPKRSVVYYTASDDLAKFTADIIHFQCYENTRILTDFSALYGVDTMKPSRMKRPTGPTHFYLTNDAWVTFRSVGGRKRGARPTEVVVDDPEYDGTNNTDVEALTQKTRQSLMSQILPMVQRANTSLSWLGTFVSKKHLLWKMMEVQKVATGGYLRERAVDPRFERWFRAFIPAMHEVKGELRSFWPAMHPVDEADRIRVGASPEVQTLEAIKEEIGPSVFLAEYMGRPGDAVDSGFPTMSKERGGWWIEQPDAEEPRKSNTMMCWYRWRGSETEIVRMRMRDFVAEYRVVMTLDPSNGSTKASDRRSCCVLAKTEHGELLVLDGWSDHCTETEQLKQAFTMANRWLVSAMWVEAVSKTLFETARGLRVNRVDEITGGYEGAVYAFTPGRESKVDRIAGLIPLAETGRLKLPWDRQYDEGFGRRLFEQVNDFNPEATDGGLANDDELDAVQMQRWPFRGRAVRRVEPEIPEGPDLIARLKQGISTDENGNSLVELAVTRLGATALLDIALTRQRGLATAEGDTDCNLI